MADYKTYARIILSNSPAISDLIDRYSYPRQIDKTQHGLPPILTQDQIITALLNPLQSIQIAIDAYIASLRAHIEAVNTEDLIELALDNLTADLKQIREKHDINEKFVREGLEKLETVFIKVKSEETELKQLNQSLQENDQKMNTFIHEHNQAWQNYREKILNEINGLFEKNGWQLGEFEKQEFLAIPPDKSPWDELLKRFQELGLDYPKGLDVNKPNPIAYFMLKAYLAAFQYHKQQLSGISADELSKILKKLLPKSINDDNKSLSKSHRLEMRDISKLSAKIKQKIYEIGKNAHKALKAQAKLHSQFQLEAAIVSGLEGEMEKRDRARKP